MKWNTFPLAKRENKDVYNSCLLNWPLPSQASNMWFVFVYRIHNVSISIRYNKLSSCEKKIMRTYIRLCRISCCCAKLDRSRQNIKTQTWQNWNNSKLNMNYTSFLYKVYIKVAQIHNFFCQSNCTHLSSWARKNQPEFPTSTKQPEENIVSFVIFPVNNVCSVLCCVELSTGLREIL